MKHFLALVLAALLVCLLSAPARAQQDFSSESKSWTFTMPAGWQLMSKEMVAKLNKEYKVRNPDHPARVVAGFIRSGGLFEYPQVVLQVLDADMTKLSWPALQRMCIDGYDESPGAEAAELVGDLIYSCGADDTSLTFNEPAHQVSAKGSIVLDSGAEVATASRAFMHSGGAVQLSCLTLHDAAGAAQKSLDPFANSFHLAAGHEFTPAPDVQRQRRASSYSGGSRYGFYGGGGVVVLIIGVILRLAIRSWVNGN